MKLLLCCMELLKYDEGVCEQDSSEWINIIDRGGLWFISDCTYLVFYAMKEEIRLHLRCIHGQETATL